MSIIFGVAEAARYVASVEGMMALSAMEIEYYQKQIESVIEEFVPVPKLFEKMEKQLSAARVKTTQVAPSGRIKKMFKKMESQLAGASIKISPSQTKSPGVFGEVKDLFTNMEKQLSQTPIKQSSDTAPGKIRSFFAKVESQLAGALVKSAGSKAPPVNLKKEISDLFKNMDKQLASAQVKISPQVSKGPSLASKISGIFTKMENDLYNTPVKKSVESSAKAVNAANNSVAATEQLSPDDQKADAAKQGCVEADPCKCVCQCVDKQPCVDADPCVDGASKAADAQDKVNKKVDAGSGKFAKMGKSALASFKKIAGIRKTIAPLEKMFMTSINQAGAEHDIKARYIGKAGDEQLGTSLFDHVRQSAVASGSDVNATLNSALQAFPYINNTSQMDQIGKFALQLSAGSGNGKDTSSAYEAITAALTGDASKLGSTFGISEDVLKAANISDLGSAGKTDELLAAIGKLLEQQGMGEGVLQSIAENPLNQLQSIKNSITAGFGEAGKGALQALIPLMQMIQDGFQTGQFQVFFNLLSSGFTAIASAATWAVGIIMQNLDIIKTILLILGVVALVLAAKFLIMALIPLIPFILIVGAIVLVLLSLQSMGIGFEQVIGFIGGIIFSLYAIVYNVFAAIVNFVMLAIESVVNYFNSMAYRIRQGMAVLIDGLLNKIRPIVEILDNLFGSSLAGRLDIVSQKVNDWVGEKPEAYELGEKMDFMSIKDSFSQGKDWGQGFANMDLGLPTDGFSWEGKDPAGAKDPMNGIGDFTDKPMEIGSVGDIGNVGKVDEVGKINDSVDISNEDLKLLRELAEIKNVQNFVTLTPTVTFGDTNVRNEGDIDTLIHRLTTKLSEDIASSASAVYG